MSANHTEGEWKISDQGANGTFITGANGQGAIAKVYNENSLIKTREEAEANAKLIAAAPELLKQIIEYVEFHEKTEIRRYAAKSNSFYHDFKKIIKKATTK